MEHIKQHMSVAGSPCATVAVGRGTKKRTRASVFTAVGGDAFWLSTKLNNLTTTAKPLPHRIASSSITEIPKKQNETRLNLGVIVITDWKSVKSEYPRAHVSEIQTFEAQWRGVCDARKCVFSCQCQRLKADD